MLKRFKHIIAFFIGLFLIPALTLAQYTEDKGPLDLTAITSIENNDALLVGDQSDSNELLKQITWANFKTLLTSQINTDAPNVTLSGEDYLSLATQAITANAINPDNLASADFGDFTCNGTNCSLDATYLTGNETITLSGDVTGTGATSITTALSTDAVADNEIDYTAVTLNDLTFDVGSVSKTEFGYLNGVTSALQTQIDAKQATLGNDDITPDMVLSTGQTDEYVLTYEATGDTWEWAAGGGAAFTDIDTDYGNETVTSDWTFNPNGTGGLTEFDLEIGDTDGSPTYGMMHIGNATFGRTNYNTASLDLDGSLILWNNGTPATSNIEFAFAESSNSVRFAIPKSGVGNATYNPRSMIVAGPAPVDDTMVTVGYWQGQGIFDNLVMDTGTDGADVGIQNDLEVEGDIFTDSIKGSTANTTIAIQPNGTGDVSLGNFTFDADQTVGAGQNDYVMTYDNTSGNISLEAAPGAGGGDSWSDPVDADIVPDTDSTYDLGDATHYFALGYIDTLYAGQVQVAGDFFGQNFNNTAGTAFVGFVDAGGVGIDIDAGTNGNVDLRPDGTGEAQVNGQEIIDESMISTGLTYSAGLVTADLGTTIDTSEITDDTITHADIADADQTTTMCIYIEDPTDTDDLNSIWANKTSNDFLLTEIWGESDQTVNFDLQVDDGTPADVNGTDISPAAGEAEDTSLSGDTTLAAGEELDLAVTSVSGTPTWVSICWTGNWVD